MEIPDHFTARGLPEARERLRYDSLSKAEKGVYDYYVEQTRYERSVMSSSYFSGKFDGKAEGRAEGREEGLAVGRRSGRGAGDAGY